jgi:hypothetical protein
LDEQGLEYALQPLRRADDLPHTRAATALLDEHEVAGLRAAERLAVERKRCAGREVRLADDQFAPARDLYDELFD